MRDGNLLCLVSRSGKERLLSHSRRLTCLSRTPEEKCIIHPVDWSLFCSSGVDQGESGGRPVKQLMDLHL